MANVPEDLHYSKDHEWVRVEGNIAVVGITDYAQDSLGDVVYVELPKPGDEFAARNRVAENYRSDGPPVFTRGCSRLQSGQSMAERGMMPASPFSTSIMRATSSRISCGPLIAR